MGSALLHAGLRVVGTLIGIVCAMLFVSAPLFVSGAREAFARVDARFEAVARTLRRSAHSCLSPSHVAARREACSPLRW